MIVRITTNPYKVVILPTYTFRRRTAGGVVTVGQDIEQFFQDDEVDIGRTISLGEHEVVQTFLTLGHWGTWPQDHVSWVACVAWCYDVGRFDELAKFGRQGGVGFSHLNTFLS